MDAYYIFRNVQQSELWSILAGSLLVLITEMSESTPSQSPHNLMLVPEQKKPDIRKCKGQRQWSTKFSSAENGRDKAISNSLYLEDKTIWGLSEREKAGI